MEYLVLGFFTGISLILAIGAQNIFVIEQGLKKQHIFIVCLICSISDLILIFLGIFLFHYFNQYFNSLIELILNLILILFLLHFIFKKIKSHYSDINFSTEPNNISKLNIDNKIDNNIKIIKSEAIKALKNIKKIFQIVLMDPPYNTNIIEKCLFKLKEFNLINQDSYIFAESGKTETFNYDGYQILDVKIYGNSKLTILKLLSSSSIK